MPTSRIAAAAAREDRVREAVVLCGGQGTRLRAALPALPKVLAPVAGRPFAAYLLRALARHGVTRVVLCTGYLAQAVRDALGDSREGMDLVYSREDTPLDTGGALRLALPLLRGDAALVVNGDSYLDADLDPLVCGSPPQPPCLLAAAALPDTSRFGRVVFGEDGAITAFTEKGLSGPGYINAGLYRFTRQAMEAIPAGRPVSLEREVFPGLIGRGLRAVALSGAFLDIGTPESYARAEAFFAMAGSTPG